MFNDQADCLQMIEGSYRKLKSYYYYNKNYIIMRERFATFEADRNAMSNSFNNLCALLTQPSDKEAICYFHNLIAKIEFCVLPKKFENEAIKEEYVTTNAIPKDKKLRTVNFFTDFPIELFILDTLWTLLLGKVSDEKRLLTNDVYGNTLANHILYRNKADNIVNSINFASTRMFDIYFYNYCKWRNNAFATLESNYASKKNSILLSLDIQSYYYNIRFNFNLHEILGEHPLIEQINNLTALMHKVYKKYFDIVKPYRHDFKRFGEAEYPLPIGLFSSMLIANLYLTKLDKKIGTLPNCSYYGRYVDDLLFCFITDNKSELSLTEIIQDILVKNNIIIENTNNNYSIADFPNLLIQKEKVKALYINANESRALIDIYNEKVKIIPSQMSIMPDYDWQLDDFNDSAYTIENFSREFKIRDIGNVNIDAFKVSRYFSTLAYKQSNINSFDKGSSDAIFQQIEKISDFFVGSQSLEYYSNWMNYAYFLVLSRKYQELKQFYNNMKKNIERIKGQTLSRDIFRKSVSLCKKTRESLNRHLEISIATALALDITATEKAPYKSINILAKKLMDANMFNHAFVSLPIANYLDYDNNVSYTRIDVKDYGRIPKGFEKAFKVKWSPRFIHFEELLLSLFLHNHNHKKSMDAELFSNEKLIDIYFQINHIKNQNRFFIDISTDKIGEYKLQNIVIPNNISRQDFVTIAVGNIKLKESECTATLKNRWVSLSRYKKRALRDLLNETYIDSKKRVDLLVLPELYIPIYWLKEIVDFSKRSQIAIVTGLQYIPDNNNQVKNYIATIFPFESGKQRYKNAFVFIREKNDYSPIEKEILAAMGKYCSDAETPHYQIFHWKGLDLATFVCFEFTDIFARALFKGKCDIIAAPVFNSDTTYFSNIIDSATRDLHIVIVQANNSVYGDSRITGPYDRDNKDIVKIKGGETDHIIIGKVDLNKILKYQAEYYNRQEANLKQLRAKRDVKKEPQKKPDIKKLSARFDNSRAKRKLR